MGKQKSLPRSWRGWILGALAAGTPAAMAPALADPPKNSVAHTKAALICEQASLAPGSTTTLGITFEIQPKWHLYWNGRNDNGVPPKAEFDLPAGFTVDAIRWPSPVRHVEPGEMLNHVYFDRVTLLVPLHVPSSAQPGSTVTLKANVSWLVCDSVCVGEDAALQIKIPIAQPGEKIAKSPESKLIEQSRARLPLELAPESKDVHFSWTAQSVTANVAGATHLAFYPDEDCVPFAEPIKDADKSGSTLTIRLGDPEKDHTALTGILEIQRETGKPAEFYHVRSLPTPASASPAHDVPRTPKP